MISGVIFLTLKFAINTVKITVVFCLDLSTAVFITDYYTNNANKKTNKINILHFLLREFYLQLLY